MMKVRVLLFAAYREAAGWSEREFEAEDGRSAGEIWERLQPELGGLSPRSPLCAINQKHAPMSTTLDEGDEVAFFPPVSGGASEEPPLREDPASLIVSEPIDVPALEAAVRTDRCGALCTFLGIVRDHHDGRPVSGVSYEAWPEMAGKELARLCAAAEENWPGVRALVVHRTGRLEVGEASVAVLAAAPHRAESFEAARFLIEEIKKSVPVWKKDHFTDGSDSWRDS
jgi:molybdopterin converting factor subunit 1